MLLKFGNTLWAADQPDFSDGNCVAMENDTEYKWSMDDCSEAYNFYCELGRSSAKFKSVSFKLKSFEVEIYFN